MLYRQYRPSTWDEVVGQEHVVRTLTGALSAGRIGHAYLFSGPRGTGKTTVARIWAKAMTCTAKKGQPCDACEACASINEGRALDVVEIDAASNRKVEDIPVIQETAATAPAHLARKVFIIDEVHMLSPHAFNALLKLLEEPPAHAVFIFATTEPHKIPLTVLSRVQRFDFKKLTQQQIADKLTRIAKAEKFKVAPEALVMVAAASDGALRDAEVMLTKLVAHSGTAAISAETVRDVLGLVPASWHAKFAGLMSVRDRAGAMRFLHERAQEGVDMDQLAKGFLEYLRMVLVVKVDKGIIASAGLALADTQATALQEHASTMDGKHLVRMIQTFTEARSRIKASPVPSLPLELAVMELTEAV